MHDREDLHIAPRAREPLCDARATHNARAIHENAPAVQDPTHGHWLSPHAVDAAAWLRSRWPFGGPRTVLDGVADAAGQALFGSAVRTLTWSAVALFAVLLVLIVHATA